MVGIVIGSMAVIILPAMEVPTPICPAFTLFPIGVPCSSLTTTPSIISLFLIRDMLKNVARETAVKGAITRSWWEYFEALANFSIAAAPNTLADVAPTYASARSASDEELLAFLFA
eukprot:CAMPEP_0118657132 /NCGR_PEP_ID=MMETSP0785-20121206/13850_1 /TAXON_ID=91992 /ORGANISM="Bolidomonas pacifica, Strain CCMP 1866" /LENGTH=115 /DNA_ID=CAMNT_0006550019 /DNA_START=266 /DNA_END=613 /DNA_ORIENTATION=-